MAKWSDKLNQMTQSAISKSKEVAGIAKLNMDNASLNLDIKNIQNEIGAYVLENKLLTEDAAVREWMAKVDAIQTNIENNNEKIRELKNVNVCPECGAEVARTSRFCNKCGAELTIPASASEVEEVSGTAEVVEEPAAGEAQEQETAAEEAEAVAAEEGTGAEAQEQETAAEVEATGAEEAAEGQDGEETAEEAEEVKEAE